MYANAQITSIFPDLYVLVVKFIFVVVQIPDWHGGQCQSGTWKKNGGGTVQMVTATASDWNQPIATATCPSGKKVTGGGGMCSFSNAILKRSSPSGNSAWVAGCSQNTNQNQYYSVTTYALCQ
ncbi:TPA: pilus assembly protein PilV [Escherichia coli]